MNGATQSLTSLRDPKEVVAQGMRVMNDLVGPGFVPAAYLRVSDGLVREESPAGPGRSGELRAWGRSRSSWGGGDGSTSGGRILHARDGPGCVRRHRPRHHVGRACSRQFGGRLHGIIRIGTRNTSFSGEVLARCPALANVIELALENALAHQELEIQANSDPLTGMSNRRGLSLYLDGDRRRSAMGILVMDIDGLKAINDAHGHDVGDKILVAVARAASGILPRGDLWPHRW